MLRALIAAGAALLIAALGALPAFAAPKAFAFATEREFGEVKRGAVLTERFEIRNAGDEPLVFERLEFSAHGMSARVRQTVEPGESALLELTWDTAQYTGEAIGHARLSTNDPNRRHIVLTLRGTLISAIAVLPVPAVYISQFVGENGNQTLEIRNNQEHPVAITRVEARSDRFSASVETLEVGRRYLLHIAGAPSAPIGRWRDRLLVHTDDPENPGLGVEVNLLVKPDIYASVAGLDFGRVEASRLRRDPSLLDLLEEQFVVTRRAGEMLITGMNSDLPFLILTQEPEGSAQIFKISARLNTAILVPGVHEGTIDLTTDDPAFPLLEMPVRITIAE